MNNCKIHIKGMHCRSCELLIEDELLKIPGITKAEVNHRLGTAHIHYENNLNETAVEKAIHGAGYKLGIDEKPLLYADPKIYQEIGLAFLLAMFLYLVAQYFGILNINTGTSGSYSSLTAVFLVGLTAGISTCMALVGGIVLGASAKYAEKHPKATTLEKFTPHLYFNIGRIASYFFFGALIGMIGSIFQLSTSWLGVLTIVVGGVMLLLGTQLLGISPFINSISFSLPKSISRLFGMKDRENREYTDKNATMMGALTFFLPCGFTQAMQLYAMSTGNPVTASLTMGVFAIGTAPGLLSVGGLTSIVKGAFSRIFFKTAGIIVIILALFNINNGMNLTGFQIGGIEPALASILGLPTANETTNTNQNIPLVNGVAEIRMKQGSFGYSPNSFTIKKGDPVKWIIDSVDSNTCAASIVSQKLGIRSGLQLGENVFEFTPTETGTIRFSCIMGMYTGSFTVVNENATGADIISDTPTPTPIAKAGGSCGKSGGCGCGGGGKKTNIIPQVGTVNNLGDTQVLKATYSVNTDIVPNQFKVKANQPVKFEIEAKENGSGCMGSVALPGLSNKVEVFTEGQAVAFDFTPTQTGTYNITCAMGVPRGQIIVE